MRKDSDWNDVCKVIGGILYFLPVVVGLYVLGRMLLS